MAPALPDHVSKAGQGHRAIRPLKRLRDGVAAIALVALALAMAASVALEGRLGLADSECAATEPGQAPLCRLHTGAFYQGHAAVGELRLISSGGATLSIDGSELLTRRPDARARATRQRTALSAGVRRLSVRTDAPGQSFEVVWSEDGKAARPVGPLFRNGATRGSNLVANTLAAARGALSTLLPLWVALALLTGMIVGSRKAGAYACCLTLVWASLLGIESIVRRSVAEPHLTTEVLAGLAPSLRPADWPQGLEAYYGDPPDYLMRARRMQGFYDAEAREPVYVALIRVCLWVSGGSDVAIGIASGLSWLAFLGAVYAVAVRVIGVRLALFALVLLSADRELVALSSMGERDQTFAAAFAWSLVAFLRVWERPSRDRGVLFGAVSALACLTRISALSYVLPALGLLAVWGRGDIRTRLRAASLAASALVLLVAPYLMSCGIGFGDPLRSINIHTGYYNTQEDQAGPAGESAAHYLFAGRSPYERVDTAAGGLMEATFGRPFPGLPAWLPAPAASGAAVFAWLGLLMLRGPGALVGLLTLLAAVPFSLTWNLGGGGDLRFVLFALLSTAISAPLGLAGVASMAISPRPERTAAWKTFGVSLALAAMLFGARVGIRGSRLWADGTEGRDVFFTGHPFNAAVVRGFAIRSELVGGQHLRASATDPRLDLQLQGDERWQLTLRWWSAAPVELSEADRPFATLPAVPENQMGQAVIDLPASPQTHRVFRFRGPISLWWARVSRSATGGDPE